MSLFIPAHSSLADLRPAQDGLSDVEGILQESRDSKAELIIDPVLQQILPDRLSHSLLMPYGFLGLRR